MTTRRFLMMAGLLSMSAVACGADPNKQANDAHNVELTSERKQLEASADDRSDKRADAAASQRNSTEANATGSPASKDRIAADAKLTEARAVYRAKATERLEKADARTAELKALVDKAGGKASTASRDALKTVETQRATVAREIDQLPNVANENWGQVKDATDTKLDALEGLVKKAATEIDKFKK